MWDQQWIQSRLDLQKAGVEAPAFSPDLTLASLKPKTVVVSIYGVSGCGKSYFLNELREKLGTAKYIFEDGSSRLTKFMLDRDLPGTSGQLSGELKIELRQEAVNGISEDCHATRKVGIVAGHYTFLDSTTAEPDLAWTAQDTNVYTHVIYLNTSPKVMVARRVQDTSRSDRARLDVAQLQIWQDIERKNLQKLCSEHGMLFSIVTDQTSVDRVAERIRDFARNDSIYNLKVAEARLDEVAMSAGGDKLETTLEAAGKDIRSERDPFNGPHGYDHFSFRQATLMMEDVADDRNLDELYEKAVARVQIHQEFLALLEEVAKHQHVKAMVVGGGRLADGFVVNGPVKKALVARLQDRHQLQVCAFGDGPLDLGMLKQADETLVVVGEEATRSRSMEGLLKSAIKTDGLRAKQVLLPISAAPMLDEKTLPVVHLQEASLVQVITAHRPMRLIAATDSTASQLLAAPTRNANIHGQKLRQAHHDVGKYLATHFVTLPGIIGLEEYDMSHVEAGKSTKGHCLLHESQTLIGPLMRGGEPMAFGVNDAFPQAMFLHAKVPTDLTDKHLQACKNVILVDGVINNGESLLPFLEHIHSVVPSMKIVVVAGVVQQGATEEDGFLTKGMKGKPQVTLVALRVSENKVTGKGGTDTGHRLFNTTHLD